jgi:hypothetical protein
LYLTSISTRACSSVGYGHDRSGSLPGSHLPSPDGLCRKRRCIPVNALTRRHGATITIASSSYASLRFRFRARSGVIPVSYDCRQHQLIFTLYVSSYRSGLNPAFASPAHILHPSHTQTTTMSSSTTPHHKLHSPSHQSAEPPTCLVSALLVTHRSIER